MTYNSTYNRPPDPHTILRKFLWAKDIRAVIVWGIIATLFATPLSAQQVDTLGIIVSPTVTILGDTTFVDIDVTIGEEPCDSACTARAKGAQRAMDAIADYLENCGCMNTGPTTINVIANAGLTVAAFLIAWQLRGIKNRPDGDDIHNEGDTNVEVVVPPHEHDNGDDDHDSESEG